MNMSEIINKVIIAILSVSIAVGISGNLLIVVTRLVKQYQRRNTSTYTFFILHLAIADLIFAFTLIFNLISEFHEKKWLYKLLLCRSIKTLQSISLSTTALFLATMAYERYCGISKPLQHHWSKIKCYFIVLFIWLYVSITMIPFLLATDIDSNQYCYDINYISSDFRKGYTLFLFLTNFAIPLTCIVVCHTLILKTMEKHKKTLLGSRQWKSKYSARQNNDETNNNRGQPERSSCRFQTVSSSLRKDRTESNESTTALIKNETKQRRNNSSRFFRVFSVNKKRSKEKEDKKLVNMLAAVTLFFIVTITPNQIYYLWLDFSDVRNPKKIVLQVMEIMATLVCLNCCINPIIYSAMDKRFRREVKAMLKGIFLCESNHAIKTRVTSLLLSVRFSRSATTSTFDTKSEKLSDDDDVFDDDMTATINNLQITSKEEIVQRETVIA